MFSLPCLVIAFFILDNANISPRIRSFGEVDNNRSQPKVKDKDLTPFACNQRKNRKGAFWEDRYHAKAVQTDQHLVQCIVYMGLNMVRAGVVKHPSEWTHSGYGEIQNPPERYRLIDRKALMQLLGIGGSDQLSLSHRSWVEEALKSEEKIRESRWSENIAVGSLSFIEQVKTDLGARGFGRKITSSVAGHELREAQVSYRDHFGCEKVPLSYENALPWRIYGGIPM